MRKKTGELGRVASQFTSQIGVSPGALICEGMWLRERKAVYPSGTQRPRFLEADFLGTKWRCAPRERFNRVSRNHPRTI